MFPGPDAVLRRTEGAVSETPLPLLLRSLQLAEKTCALLLRHRQVEKVVHFEEGTPVGCDTNLLHETLGHFLVAKGGLTAPEFKAAHEQSVSSGVQLGEVLVARGLLTHFDLYKQLQANLGNKLLDCFRLVDAKYALQAPRQVQSPVRMNAAQIILTGASNFLPFDLVCTHLTFDSEQRFALSRESTQNLTELKLTAKDMKLLSMLKGRPRFADLALEVGVGTEALLRRLYALSVLGVVVFAESPKAAVKETDKVPSAWSAPVILPAPGAPTSLPLVGYADEDEATRNALSSAFLDSRKKDPFELLNVEPDVAPLALRKAFLGAAERFSPLRFRTPELKEKAESMLMAYARAYADLANPEQLTLWRQRRQAAAEKEKKAGTKASTAEQFRIRTDLLDAKSQFETGKKRLEQKDFRKALELFEYACDIDPRAIHLAYRGWARFQLGPAQYGKLALQELMDALTKDEACHEAMYFAGEIHRAAGNDGDADQLFRRAVKANPKERRYADALASLARQKKSAR